MSLGIAEWGWRNEPQANFYLTPTRVWELMIGALASFYLQRERASKEWHSSIALIDNDFDELIKNVTDEQLRKHLYSPETPDIDLIIRTSGESRLSGFLLWQSAYSEVIFQDVYWPEFRKIDFLRCLREYSQRERRFGK